MTITRHCSFSVLVLMQVFLQGVGWCALGEGACTVSSSSILSRALSITPRASYLFHKGSREGSSYSSVQQPASTPPYPPHAAFLLAQNRPWAYLRSDHAELACVHQRWQSTAPRVDLLPRLSDATQPAHLLLPLGPPPAPQSGSSTRSHAPQARLLSPSVSGSTAAHTAQPEARELAPLWQEPRPRGCTGPAGSPAEAAGRRAGSGLQPL